MLNLNQITIPSTDLEKAIKFYEKLGLHLIVDSRPRYARFECKKGDATLSLHKVDTIKEGEGVIVYFEIEKLDEYVNRLVAEGITFEELPKDQVWLWREARLKDTDGNQLILYHAGKNRKNPPWRIN